jgi:undecaprenyl-diphosphatase
MTLLQILVLAIIQGFCEVLPVSSSAHVIIAEKLMGIDPTAPEMTLLLVMLHTGTMLAVILYFWSTWRWRYFSSRERIVLFAKEIVLATGFTGVVGLILLQLIERVILAGSPHSEVEQIFGNVYIIATGLVAVGVLIIWSGRASSVTFKRAIVGLRDAAAIGAIQGLCLPFRGFSRSGATISTGLLLGLDRERVEEFSFALVVVLTPAVILREVYRLLHAHAGNLAGGGSVVNLLMPSLIGMALSFVAGLLAVHWLSRWLKQGHWHYFGYYCLAVAGVLIAWDRLHRL